MSRPKRRNQGKIILVELGVRAAGAAGSPVDDSRGDGLSPLGFNAKGYKKGQEFIGGCAIDVQFAAFRHYLDNGLAGGKLEAQSRRRRLVVTRRPVRTAELNAVTHVQQRALDRAGGKIVRPK